MFANQQQPADLPLRQLLSTFSKGQLLGVIECLLEKFDEPERGDVFRSALSQQSLKAQQTIGDAPPCKKEGKKGKAKESFDMSK